MIIDTTKIKEARNLNNEDGLILSMVDGEILVIQFVRDEVVGTGKDTVLFYNWNDRQDKTEFEFAPVEYHINSPDAKPELKGKILTKRQYKEQNGSKLIVNR